MKIEGLPHSTELEQAVLGTIILDHSCMAQVVDLLDENVFYKRAHQVIYNTLSRMFDKNSLIDLINVVERLKMSGQLEEAGGASYVAKLTNGVVSTTGVETQARMLVEYHMKREGQKIGQGLMMAAQAGEVDPFDMLVQHQEMITSLQEMGTRGSGQDISNVVMRVSEQRGKHQAGQLIGIPSGLDDLDHLTSGLCAPDLIIMAARPGAGKTAFMLNIAYHVAVIQQIPTAIFSLEMSAEQLVMRMESIGTNIWQHKIRHNELNKLEEDALNRFDSTLASSPLVLDDQPAITLRELRAKALVMKKRHGIKLIMVDYLQLMRGGGKKGQSREGEISEISSGLKALAKEMRIPIIALSQLSREVEKRPDKRPQLSDLRESGAIEQDADIVILLMRPSYYHINEPVMVGQKEYPPHNLLIAELAKNRHSSTDQIALYCDLACMQIKNMEHEQTF